MNNSAVYERDLLYPTENIFEPGSIHLEILNADKKGRMPVVIESKTEHSPIKYIDSIMRIMQSDIFDRVHIDIKNSVCLYIKINDELKDEFGDKKFLAVSFQNGKTEYSAIDDMDL